MWGQGTYKVGHKVEKWIFSPEMIFFDLKDKKKVFKIFGEKNAEKYADQARNGVKNLGQFWQKMVIFEFSSKYRNRRFFRLQRLSINQKIRKL